MSRSPSPPLSVLVDRLYYGTNRILSERLERAGFPGIRPAHGKVFENLGEGRSISELAARAQVTKQTMADLVLSLEKLGYLEREPDPGDKRAWLVTLTPNGTRAVRAAVELLDELERQWSKKLGARRFGEAHQSLTELAHEVRGAETNETAPKRGSRSRERRER